MTIQPGVDPDSCAPPIVRSTPRPIFILRIRPEPHVDDPVRALRHALKKLLRAYGIRVLKIDQEKKT
jgi:hypothetical protein